MTINEVRLFPVLGKSQLKAKANVTIDCANGAQITIKGLRVMDDGKKAPWVGPPTERYEKNGKFEYAETVWINQIAQAELYPKILEAYSKNIKSNSLTV